MSYNRWLSGHEYYTEEDLEHYGVIGMRWGVRKARKYSSQSSKYKNLAKTSTGAERDEYSRQAQEYQKRYDETVNRLRSKSSEKLHKYDTQYKKLQGRADKTYSKAQSKEHSFFSSKEAADKAYTKASKQQWKSNRIAYKGKKFYEQMVKAYADIPITMDKETIQLGKEFINRVEIQSHVLYATKK